MIKPRLIRIAVIGGSVVLGLALAAIEVARACMGYESEMTWMEGLYRTIEWYTKQIVPYGAS